MPTLLRKQALEQINAPDDVDRLMPVTRPRMWLALLALCAVVIAAVGWGLLGRVYEQVPAQSGILLQPGSVKAIVAPEAGVVSSVTLKQSDTVSKGDAVASLVRQGDTVPVRSYVAGTATDVVVTPGASVNRGDPVAVLRQGDESLRALLYVNQDDGADLAKGTRAFLLPSTVSAEEYGYLLGTVVSVSELPLSQEQMMLELANEDLVQALRGDGDRLEVVVDLEDDSSTPSGFSWSIDQGPPFALSNLTLITGTFVTGEQRPAELVLPSER